MVAGCWSVTLAVGYPLRKRKKSDCSSFLGHDQPQHVDITGCIRATPAGRCVLCKRTKETGFLDKVLDLGVELWPWVRHTRPRERRQLPLGVVSRSRIPRSAESYDSPIRNKVATRKTSIDELEKESTCSESNVGRGCATHDERVIHGMSAVPNLAIPVIPPLLYNGATRTVPRK